MSEWPIVSLSEVLHHRKGSITIDNQTQYSLCRVQLHRRGVLERGKQFGYEIKTKKQQLCKSGDLIVAEMDAKFGGYGFIPESLDGAIVSSHYYLYELDHEKLDRGYMETLIAAQEIQKQIEAKGSTNYSSIRAWEFLEYKIPLPPLEKQKNIASQFHKFEKFSISHGREAAVQSTYLTQVRQAILQEAIEGKLTAEWRASRRDAINRVPTRDENNDAAVLLEKIKAEKAALIAKGKLKKEKPLPPIEPGEVPFALPEGWVWVRFQEITRLITDGKHGDCQDQGNSGYYFLSAKDIQQGRLLFDYARQINKAEFEEVHRRTNLEPGDICMVNTGATVGKLAIAPDEPRTRKTTFQKSVAVIKVFSPHIETQYIRIFLSHDIKNLLAKSWGSAINNLLLGDLKEKLIPLPPLTEQHAIVERVDKLLAMVDQLEQQVAERKVQAEELMQAVLREAFGS